MENIEISIIIPSYNEGANLKHILPDINRVMKQSNVSHEIIVVDTVEKTDDTEMVCLRYGACYINRAGDNSYGSAVRTGIQNARGKHSVFMDGDGSHAANFINELIGLRDRYDVVIASRYVEGGGMEAGRFAVGLSRFLSRVYSKYLGLDISDLSNGFRMYKTDILKSLKLSSENLDILQEIIFELKLKDKDLKIREIPYHFTRRVHGKTKRRPLAFFIAYIVTFLRLIGRRKSHLTARVTKGII